MRFAVVELTLSPVLALVLRFLSCQYHSTIAPTIVTSEASLLSLQKIGALWHVWQRLTETSTLTLYHVITEHLLSTVLPLVSPFSGVQGWCHQRLFKLYFMRLAIRILHIL